MSTERLYTLVGCKTIDSDLSEIVVRTVKHNKLQREEKQTFARFSRYLEICGR